MFISTPRYTIIEEDAIQKLPYILEKLNLKKPLVVTGKNTKKYNIFDFDYIYYNELESFKDKNYDSIIGIGGGKAIDYGKFLSYKLKVPFISVPTTASNDGISSPIVSIKQPSFMVEAPIAIIADINIIKNSPKRLIRAGIGDALSNITAVLDWKLAYKEGKEKYYSESSAIFSWTIANELINYILKSKNLKNLVPKLVKALVGSGIAICIANSSRPASGSEHLFSHALDMLKEKYDFDSLHGEQCGLGTIMMSYLHEMEDNSLNIHKKIKTALEKVKAPTKLKDINIDEDIALEALLIAHKIRKRWTILRDGLSKKKAQELIELIS
ncbi:iron-containing alcohol dehydrogenase [Methanocaldococcus indicus]|uniref:iron-containing alcohol dehydrogenase n=1 Tax=Methanocaldococcus indicus TaxID=213231 RepID=UPI003C6CCAA1